MNLSLVHRFSIFTGVLLMGILYEKYKKKEEKEIEVRHYDIVSKFLLNDTTNTDKQSELFHSELPILWVFIDYEKNARKWSSFGSRTSKRLNKPYHYLTLQRIIQHATDKFKVCFIDEDSFNVLLPEWTVKLSNIPDPIRTNMRIKGIFSLLYKYGGFMVPPSFLAMNDLSSIYTKLLENHDVFMMPKKNTLSDTTDGDYVPNIEFMGCRKESNILNSMLSHIEWINNTNGLFNHEIIYENEIMSMIEKHVNNNKIRICSPKQIGVESVSNKPIQLFDLLESNDNVFNARMKGIYIPDKEILDSHRFQWFQYLSVDELLQMDNNLQKYL